LPIYVVVLDAWFGVVSWSRNIPYTDKPVFRIIVLLLVLDWIVILALMYFASRAPASLFSYLWGIVVMLILIEIVVFMIFRETKAPQPFLIYGTGGILSLAAAIAYSIWVFAFYPVPDVINWVFVAIAFTILVGMRVWMKVTHTWRPEEK
ncbi:MAG: hypothetical protein V3W14_07755, partial [Candidatus Neomarinimicrobiota bacterium]